MGAKGKYSKKLLKKVVNLIESDDYTIKEICLQVGITAETWFQWLKSNAEFSDSVEKAKERRLDTFRKAARSGLLTLLQGTEFEEVKTEYTTGKDPENPKKSIPVVKSQTRIKKLIQPNPTSVIFALKNLDPDTFADISEQRLTGKDGQPLFERPDMSKLSTEDLETLAAIHAKISK